MAVQGVDAVEQVAVADSPSRPRMEYPTKSSKACSLQAFFV